MAQTSRRRRAAVVERPPEDPDALLATAAARLREEGQEHGVELGLKRKADEQAATTVLLAFEEALRNAAGRLPGAADRLNAAADQLRADAEDG